MPMKTATPMTTVTRIHAIVPQARLATTGSLAYMRRRRPPGRPTRLRLRGGLHPVGGIGRAVAACHHGVEITVNGQKRSVPPGTTVEGLLNELGLSGQPAAVEVNKSLVPSGGTVIRCSGGGRLDRGGDAGWRRMTDERNGHFNSRDQAGRRQSAGGPCAAGDRRQVVHLAPLSWQAPASTRRST